MRLLACFAAGSGLGSGLWAQPLGQSDVQRHANIFDPVSIPAASISSIAWFVILICLGIFLVVGGLLAYAVFRFRRTPGDDREPPQVYGSNQIELAWTVIPLLIVTVLILVTARVIGEIQDAQLAANALKVRIVGHQWWWEIHYPDYGIVTANELHIPVSTKQRPRPTRLILESADVVHSYWVPQLAGKTDVVPNRRNSLWFDPWATGTYLGNCAEYCGTQHAKMLIRVVVESPEDFEKWLRNQAVPPAENPAVAAGRDLFLSTSCVNCHRVGGTIAMGSFGPDLTHLMSRATIAGCSLPNTPDNLRAWVQDPQKLKVGCLMPNMLLDKAEVEAITQYLLTLR
jgi:cytochrome c oxidase subunit II